MPHLTPFQILAAAEITGSPVLKLLVIGHLQAGNHHLAEQCLAIPAVKLAILDMAFPQALESVAAAGAVAAVVAHLSNGADSDT